MLIRKQFKFEGAHVVRNCSSQRCRENIHGHSYIVEVFISSDQLDDGYMVMDFCRLDKVKEFIESLDHTYALWHKEENSFKEFIYRYNKRVAELPVSPSAEGYALLFFYVIDKILQSMPARNGEGHTLLYAVRVHETATGYAEASRPDLQLVHFEIKDILFSEGVKEEWKTKDWWETLSE